MPESYLIIAEHRRGHGLGHLHRCAGLVRGLSGCTVDWLLPESGDSQSYSRDEALALLAGSPGRPDSFHEDRFPVGTGRGTDYPVRWIDTPEGPYDKIIVDRRSMGLKELQPIRSRGIVIGIDAAGDLREYASYLVDALPTPPGMASPNVADTGFLPLPERLRRSWPESPERALVSLGGEPARERTHPAATALCREIPAVDAIVTGAPRQDAMYRPLEPTPLLPEQLHQYDLVVTHFGVLAYQALWAGVPVVLLNPTDYHEKLSRRAGFPTARDSRELCRLLQYWKTILAAANRLRPKEDRDLAAHLRALLIPGRLHSPSGGLRYQPVIERFPERTFFRNRRDRLIFLQNFAHTGISYDHSYFFSDYYRQYGRTYLEDFSSIAAAGRRRIRTMLDLFRGDHPPNLLDIGCAYGPFLFAASQAGCRVLGVEINREAVEYVQGRLELPAVHADLQELDFSRLCREQFNNPPDLVTMWYVIEHIQDLDTMLAGIAAAMRGGGILAFSTPHGKGISRRRSLREFLRASPADHYTVWDAAAARAVLKNHGFRVRVIRVTGHHPERFFSRPVRALHPLLRACSRILRLGDTFEVYAEKV